jgi:hypothetical protein
MLSLWSGRLAQCGECNVNICTARSVSLFHTPDYARIIAQVDQKAVLCGEVKVGHT